MRFKFLILIFSYLFGISVSQSQPMFMDSTYIWSEAFFGFIGFVHSYKYTLEPNPTYINDTAYYEVLVTTMETSEDWQETGTFLRADHQKVYAHYGQGEGLIYDFNLEVNDVFTPFATSPLTVLAIDSISLENGELRKRLKMGCGTSQFNYVYWIEGIGSLSGLIPPQVNCAVDYNIEMLCVKRNDTLLYRNPDYSTCWIMATSTKEVKTNISFYPNPTNDHIIISDPDLVIESLNVFDSYGKKVYSGNGFEMEKLDFPPGCYYFICQLNSGEIYSDKIIRF